MGVPCSCRTQRVGAGSDDRQEPLFENEGTTLQPKATVAPSKALEAKVETLERQVAQQDPVIAWVTEVLLFTPRS